jgi:hypothetical protein
LWKYPSRRFAAIEHVRHDRGLDVIELVRDAGGLGKVERVDHRPSAAAHLELFLDVVLQAAPRFHLGDIDPVERPQISGGNLKNCHWSPSKSTESVNASAGR